MSLRNQLRSAEGVGTSQLTLSLAPRVRNRAPAKCLDRLAINVRYTVRVNTLISTISASYIMNHGQISLRRMKLYLLAWSTNPCMNGNTHLLLPFGISSSNAGDNRWWFHMNLVFHFRAEGETVRFVWREFVISYEYLRPLGMILGLTRFKGLMWHTRSKNSCLDPQIEMCLAFCCISSRSGSMSWQHYSSLSFETGSLGFISNCYELFSSAWQY